MPLNRPFVIAERPALRACLASQPPLRPLPDAPHPTYAVTSLTAPFAVTAARRDPPWRDTLWHGRHRAGLMPRLIVYHENSLEGENKPIVSRGMMPFVDCLEDVYLAAPRLQRMLSKRRAASAIESFYDIPGIMSLADKIMDGKALIKKVVAIASAAHHVEVNALLLWLDVDAQIVGTWLDAYCWHRMDYVGWAV